MSNKPHTSFAEMSNGEVGRLAEVGLKRIQARRNAEFEQKIAEQMKKDQRGFWAIICKKPEVFMSRDEAIAYLKLVSDCGFFSEWQWCQVRYEESESRLERLLTLATHGEGKIYLSTDDMHLLTWWGEKESQ